MKKILTLWSALALLLLFLAFRPNDISVVVKGNVTCRGLPLSSAEVAVFKDSSTQPNTYYYEPTSFEGKYSLQFNAPLHQPVYIQYKKKGYTTFRRSYTASPKEKSKSLDPVTLLKLEKNEGLAKFSQAENSFIVYKDNRFASPTCFDQSSIAYFSYISKDDTIANKHHRGTWYQVSFAHGNSNETTQGWYFDEE